MRYHLRKKSKVSLSVVQVLGVYLGSSRVRHFLSKIVSAYWTWLIQVKRLEVWFGLEALV